MVSSSYYGYNARGELSHQLGSASYPQFYEYDIYGQQEYLTTYRNNDELIDFSTSTWPSGVGRSEGDTTNWQYDAFSGFLKRKQYADGKGTSYFYYDSGLLYMRVWQRGVTTFYHYDDAGYPEQTAYWGDSTHWGYETPDINWTYNRAGRLVQVDNATYEYSADGQVSNYDDGNYILDITYPSYGKRGELTLSDWAGNILTHKSTYNTSTGRLETVQELDPNTSA